MKIAFVAGATLLVAVSAAYAEPSAMAKACANDIRSVCSDVTPGGGKLRDCVKEHFSDLSSDCQIAIVKAAAVGRACKEDVKKLCADVKPGKGAIAECMHSHTAELSDDCKDAMAKAEGDENSVGISGTLPLPAPQVTQPKVTQQKSTGVALQTQSGIFVVPVLVDNAIKLNFAIDSGSAVVSIPADVVMTLIRMGKN